MYSSVLSVSPVVLPSLQDLLDSREIFFGIDSYGVVRSFGNVDLDSMIEESQLLEALGTFEFRFGPGAELFQCFSAIAVEA